MKIAIHAFDGITLFDLAAPLLVFGEMSRLGLAPAWETVAWKKPQPSQIVSKAQSSSHSSSAASRMFCSSMAPPS